MHPVPNQKNTVHSRTNKKQTVYNLVYLIEHGKVILKTEWNLASVESNVTKSSTWTIFWFITVAVEHFTFATRSEDLINIMILSTSNANKEWLPHNACRQCKYLSLQVSFRSDSEARRHDFQLKMGRNHLSPFMYGERTPDACRKAYSYNDNVMLASVNCYLVMSHFPVCCAEQRKGHYETRSSRVIAATLFTIQVA